MNTIGIGIIGTGSIANGGHAPAIANINNAKLVGVLSRDLKRGQDFIKEHKFDDAIVHTSLDSFIGDKNIQIAIICSPDALHASQAEACIKSGKNVLIEKPMALNINDCQHLIKLAEEYKVTLTTGFHLRHHSGHRILQEQIKNNRIGNIINIRVIWAWPQPDNNNWRARAELAKWWSLSAVGTHCFDMIRWMSGNDKDFTSLGAVTSNAIWGGPHDESAVVCGALTSGTTFDLTSSVQFGPYNRLEIFGSSGYSICQNTFGRAGGGDIWINDSKIDFIPINPFVAQLQDLINCVIANKTPIVDAYAGLRNVQDLSMVVK